MNLHTLSISETSQPAHHIPTPSTSLSGDELLSAILSRTLPRIALSLDQKGSSSPSHPIHSPYGNYPNLRVGQIFARVPMLRQKRVPSSLLAMVSFLLNLVKFALKIEQTMGFYSDTTEQHSRTPTSFIIIHWEGVQKHPQLILSACTSFSEWLNCTSSVGQENPHPHSQSDGIKRTYSS